jgi:hypothetical protein
MIADGSVLSTVNKLERQDLVASVDGHSDAGAGLILRFHDADNYLAAVYAPTAKAVYLLDRKNGVDGDPLGSMPVAAIGPDFVLNAEVRGPWRSPTPP